ncbi:MAG: FtsX-like permease family protein [Bullifex sp.]
MKCLCVVKGYLFTKNRKERSRNIRITAGLVFSTMVLLSVLSIMDHLQNSRFTYIKKIRSFPVVLKNPDIDDADSLKEEFFDSAIVFEYRTAEGLLKTAQGESAVTVRYVSPDYEGGLVTTGGVGERLLIPYRLYLGSKGGEVSLTTLEEGKVARIAPRTRTYGSYGTFQTALGSEFDLSTVFLPLEAAPESSVRYIAFIPFGISEDELVRRVESLNTGTCITWKESEASLYGAMLVEKNVMSLLLMSLYLVIFVQVVQNSSVSAASRKRELVSLYLMGYRRRDIALIAALMAFFMTSFSFMSGAVLAKVFLMAIPYCVPLFQKGSLTLDVSALPAVYGGFTLLSALSYVYFFMKQLKEGSIREVLNSV